MSDDETNTNPNVMTPDEYADVVGTAMAMIRARLAGDGEAEVVLSQGVDNGVKLIHGAIGAGCQLAAGVGLAAGRDPVELLDELLLASARHR